MIHANPYFWAVGFLPIGFWAAMLWTHWRKGKVGEIFWMCHMSNLLLAAGMIFDQPLLIEAATPWLVAGVPLWVVDMMLERSLIPASVLSHAGGTAVGLYALHQINDRHGMWAASFIFYLIMQPVSRWLTPAYLNVNVSLRTYDPLSAYFPNFTVFRISAAAFAAASLGGISWLLNIYI